MKRLLQIIKKGLFRIGSLINPTSCAKRMGVTLGTESRIIGWTDWGTEPWLISIGNHVTISCGCSFITHDGSIWIFKKEKKYKDVIRYGKISIKDNCFIGTNTTIMPGVQIGKNCIIGACSLVTKNIPEGEVWGGVPAHFIMKSNEFGERCLKETPAYDRENYYKNKKEEVLKWYGEKSGSA